MDEEDPIKRAKEGVSVVSEIIKAAGDDPTVKVAASNLGKSAVTLTKTINNALLPLAAVNFAFDKARVYFSENFQKDLSEKADDIPPEDLVEPKASIAGPTLQGLAFTHEEENLKEMFLSLLTTAMDGRKSDIAHPAFVEIIKQLDSEDARLVQSVLKADYVIPIIEIYVENKEGHDHKHRLPHVLNLRDIDTNEYLEDPKIPAMVDNWIRLGLAVVDYDKHLTDLSKYEWAEQRPEYLRLCETLNNDTQKAYFKKGIIYRTEFGKQFADAIGLL